MKIQNVSTGVPSQFQIRQSSQEGSGKFLEDLKLKEKKDAQINSQDSFVHHLARTQSQFSGTIQERFEQMEKLNEETDWGALSDIEKVKLLTDRYRAAFDEFDLVMSGLYKPYLSSHMIIGEHYSREGMKYIGKGGIAPLQSKIEDCYREAYYGTCTDEELRAQIMNKYKGAHSMESKFLMIDEMRRCGLTKNGELDILESMKMQVFSQVENANKTALYGTNMSISQHPRFLDMYMSYAKGVGAGKGYAPNWTEIIEEAKNMLQSASDQPYYEHIIDGMDSFLEEVLKN